MMASGNTNRRSVFDNLMDDFKLIKEEIQISLNDKLKSGHAGQDDSSLKRTTTIDGRKITDLQTSFKKIEDLLRDLYEPRRQDEKCGGHEEPGKEKTVKIEEKDLKQQMKELKDDNKRLKKENKELKQKIQHLSATRKIGHAVYMHSYYHGGMMDIVRKHLENEISLRFEDVEFKVYKNTDDMIEGSPLIVLCINATRLKTDAVNALKDVKELENTVLVIFHHKEPHALTFPPSSQSLIGQQFSLLVRIFDMAFLEKKGVYKCNVNAYSLNGIEDFLKVYLKPKKK